LKSFDGIWIKDIPIKACNSGYLSNLSSNVDNLDMFELVWGETQGVKNDDVNYKCINITNFLSHDLVIAIM
jgi:hypothetical protein